MLTGDPVEKLSGESRCVRNLWSPGDCPIQRSTHPVFFRNSDLTNIKVRIMRGKRGNQAPFNYLRMTKIRVRNTKESRKVEVWSYDNLRQQLSSAWLKNDLETFSSALGEKVAPIKKPSFNIKEWHSTELSIFVMCLFVGKMNLVLELSSNVLHWIFKIQWES